MASGEAFTQSQLRDISRAVNTASAESGLHFSLFVGSPDGTPRSYADRLLAALGSRAPGSVVVLVAPEQRSMEIVTGPDAAVRISDRSCALTALSMRSAFAGGDLFGGIVTGMRMLAEAAGASRAIEQPGGAPEGGVPAVVVESAGH